MTRVTRTDVAVNQGVAIRLLKEDARKLVQMKQRNYHETQSIDVAFACRGARRGRRAACLHAEDIDIFSTRNGPNDLPNVLIIWDNSANWGASMPGPDCSFSDGSGGPKANAPGKEQGYKIAIEKCAIYNVIDALPVNADGSAAVQRRAHDDERRTAAIRASSSCRSPRRTRRR